MTKLQLGNALHILLCFQFRRSICKYSTNALNKIYAVLPREIGDAEDIPKKILDVLTKKVRTQSFPRNEEFRSQFINADLYSAKLAKYTLAMLENVLNSKEKVSLTEQISIEHIMPQTLSSTWRAELGKNFEQIHAQWLHTIGNLTLSGSNSELGNKTFSEKKTVFAQSNFALSRDIVSFASWRVEQILERANKLADMALQIWSLPLEYNATSDNVEIDYSATYNIMDNVKVTNELPRSYIVDDDEKSVDSWKKLFLGVLKFLYEYDQVEFEKILNNETFKNNHLAEPASSDYEYRSKSPDEICPGFYAETGFSAQSLINFTQIATEIYGLQEYIYFTLKRKSDSALHDKDMTETQILHSKFWKAFVEYAKANLLFSSIFNFQKPSHLNWYMFAVGSSELHLYLTVSPKEKRIGVDIYIKDNKEIFRRLKSQQKQLEAFLGMRIECVEATKACRVKTFYSGDIKDRDSWESLFEWFVSTVIKFRELITQFIQI